VPIIIIIIIIFHLGGSIREVTMAQTQHIWKCTFTTTQQWYRRNGV